MKDFTKRWKDKTECSEGYKTTDCKNGPKATPTPTAPPAQGAAAGQREPTPTPQAATDAARTPPRAALVVNWPRDGTSAADAVARLDELTRKLRRECPWDREQDERSIVPHTVGEAYELAAGRARRRRREAAGRARRRALPGALPVAAARGARRRARWPRWPTTCTPSSCAGTRTSSATSRSTAPARCCATGTRSRRARTGREPGIFGDVPENLPGPLYALKTQRRAASTGFDFDHVPYEGVRGELDELEAAADPRGALPRGRRRAVRGGQRRAQAQGRSGARAAGLHRALPRSAWRPRRSWPRPTARDWDELDPESQLGYYAPGAAGQPGARPR